MLFSIILTIVLVGVLMYFVNLYVPMDEKIKGFLNVVVIIALVFWFVWKLGLMAYIG